MLDCIVTFRASYALCTVVLLVSDISNSILFNTLSKELLLPRPAGLGQCTGTLYMPKFSIILWKSCSLFNVVLELYVSIQGLCYNLFTPNWNQCYHLI